MELGLEGVVGLGTEWGRTEGAWGLVRRKSMTETCWTEGLDMLSESQRGKEGEHGERRRL